MNILITGATGFLGQTLCRFLENAGHDLTKLNSKKCDLRKESSLYCLDHKQYDLIFHLAAWTQAGDFCIHHPGEQWVMNQYINSNVVSWWNAAQPQAKFVFMGTSCAYAPGSNLVEIEFMAGEPTDSLYTYAMTKRMLYQGAKALGMQYDRKWLCAVPSTLYGANYHTDGRQMHFIFDLIRKILRGKKYGEPVVLWGDGYQKRELVFVDDFVKILWELVEKQNNEIVNIGAGEEFTIRTFARHICEHVGYPEDKIEYDTSRYVGAKSKCLNIDKVKGIIDEYKLTPLNQGLAMTIDWFLEEKAYELSS
ncbi:NAD-dependent epimerase/dehydratase family protein [Desulfovibrio sp. JC022]|uniref:NAD-dependent epimerase/dehydratase family protein n=1 Tax=Desulfovibrio sp. JC022 TaxID=2593642 RepID=UPI0013CF7DD1|nr:NAD-dependent epimerase/dehydratase family protein [Desulfovibrio sp. JC022]NDV24960.1 NAD-dependent epimerase/dehydratase family protein [Desulfovibrio sp. JC022]